MPTEQALLLAIRTEQIAALETGVTNTIDPLGGSYYVEALTNQMEAKIGEIIGEIDSEGGIVKQIENGAIQRQLARQSYELQKKISSGEKVLVGVNKFKIKEEEKDLEVYKTDPETIHRQVTRLKDVKAKRDNAKVKSTLSQLEEAARRNENILPHLFEPLKAMATVGEIIDTLKKVYGTYKEPTTV